MDLELEKFKTEIDLRAFAASRGFQLSRKDSWRGSAVMKHPRGEKIIIKRDGDRHWVFYSVKSDASGTVLDFAKHFLGLSLGAARKELRSFMGLPSSALPTYPPLAKVVKDRIRVERAYARMQTAGRHVFLENERGIPRHLLASRRFAGRIRTDARGNAVFPQFDGEGLSGFEIKGPGWTSFATGGTKSLFTSHAQRGDNRFALCESGVDALSYAALFPDEHTRYGSLGGRPSPSQRELIRAAAAALPASATIIAAMDADAAGRDIAELVREAVMLAARPDLHFEIHEPQGFKDWNDQLRGTTPLPAHAKTPEAARSPCP